MQDQKKAGRYIGLLMGLVIGAFGLLWAYTASSPQNFLPRTYGSWRAVLSMVRDCDTSEVAILGASQASIGIVPNEMGLRQPVKNYALLAGTPVEAYYMAKRLYRCPAPPKVVVLAYSGYDLSGSEFFWRHAATFGLFSFGDMQEIAHNEARLKQHVLYNSAFGSEPPPAMKNFFYLSRFPPYEMASLIAARGGGRRAENDQLTAEAIALNGQHLFTNNACTTWPGWEVYRDDFTPAPLNSYYLDQLLGFLKAHQVKVLFLSPPMNSLTWSEIKPRYVSDYERYFADLQRRHPEMKIVGPLFPHLDRCYFTDTFHLNRRGADAFSRIAGERLAPELKQLDARQTTAQQTSRTPSSMSSAS